MTKKENKMTFGRNKSGLSLISLGNERLLWQRKQLAWERPYGVEAQMKEIERARKKNTERRKMHFVMLFSRGHATLHLAVSVRPSVGRSHF